jgi:hypothetical protein
MKDASVGCRAVLEDRLFEEKQAPLLCNRGIAVGNHIFDSSPYELE